MTCVDVMYQPLTSAFPAYPRATAACSSDFSHGQSLSRMHEPLDLGPTSSLSTSSSSLSYPVPTILTPSSSGSAASIVLSPSTSRASSSSSSGLVKADSERDSEPKGAQYITANCVLLTYFNGDTASVVDDHFTRALSADALRESKALSPKAPTPMSARNLPPSFWNSSYQYQHHLHHFLGSNSQYHPQQHHAGINSGSGVSNSSGAEGFHTTHPYLSPALHGLSSLQGDPWAYNFSSTASTMSSYPHRHLPYDLSYPSSARLSQNYSSFLMQPSAVRSAQFSAMSSHCDVSKQPEHSRSRFSDHRLVSDYTPHHSSFSAIDAEGLQGATKDLYWF
ncbi:unnamed protein product [Candidula unifasciata]|uniref:Transcription cofactor vestigial-like protein 2 n=1 Tax=Candidula unifasciata TaxID=100452 RepID=A0A8S4A2F8_9EUPU|nr:unnamed protein product [Candidula unifasciata]